MRRVFATIFVAIAFLAVQPDVARADSNANTPRLAVQKIELWLAVAEAKPSLADLDAGMGAAAAAEERMAMLHTEMAAVASRRRTLIGQASTARKKIEELRAEQRAAKSSENGIKRSGGGESRILELEQQAKDFDTQAETLYSHMFRIGEEEHGIVDAVGRMMSVADMIQTSSMADGARKQKAAALTQKMTRTYKLHASMILTLRAL